MNNLIKKLKSILNIFLLLIVLIALVACGEEKEQTSGLDSESDALKLGYNLDSLKINPFFIESTEERELCSFVFSEFLTTDINGDIVYGDQYNTIVKTMNNYYLDEYHNKKETFKTGYKNVFDFTIKKGMKFSDGVDITLEDVLFNLYVYLDPAYDGYSTLKNTNIVGLEEFLTQLTKANKNEYLTKYEALYADYFAFNGIYHGTATAYSYEEWCLFEKIFNEAIYNVLRNNIFSWMNPELRYELLEDSYYIINFLREEGLAANMLIAIDETNGYIIEDGYKYNLKKDSSGEYIIINKEGEYKLVKYNDLTEIEKDSYKQNQKYTKDKNYEADCFITYDSHIYTIDEIDYDMLLNLMKKYYTLLFGTIDYNRLISNESVEGDTLNSVMETVKKNFVENMNKDNPTVDSISGIYILTVDGQETLRIELNEEDSTILQKLKFFVCPKHYYTTGYNNLFRQTNYGVPFDKSEFIANLKSFDFSPVGSGPYKMIFDGTYKNDGYLCLERNNYFETMRGNNNTSYNIKNANIKYLTIYDIEEGKEYESIVNGDIYYVNVPFSKNNATAITQEYGIAISSNNGYGSIVIDQTVIPNLYERMAIASVMDKTKVYDYYPENVCNLLEYPSSTVYPYSLDSKDANKNYDSSLDKAINYFKQAGYEFDEESGKFINGPSYIFYLDTKESINPFGSIFSNAQALLEQIGIMVRIVSGEKKDGEVYAVCGVIRNQTMDNDLNSLGDIEFSLNDVYYRKDVKTWELTMGAIEYNDKTLTQEEAVKELNNLIVGFNNIMDTTAKKTKYKEILSLYNSLTIEIPVFESYNLYVYNSELISEDYLPNSINFCYGLLKEIWKVTYNE